ncbi:hypothetical protein PBI_GAIA_91 [Mycobacterium phage Gaia]|uniref:Uncharacterized protein n=1 Tax=Mycobacterium phage Gaia TaxID=1486472 RepID=A0A068F8S1_9CAUD|nr:hypothetical protein VC46_gp142 [Mycobacterium phage Gaia]AID58910.1 hypothetical protein PBI_GAIA_91 [Mycobacterium phage Gaia]
MKHSDDGLLSPPFEGRVFVGCGAIYRLGDGPIHILDRVVGEPDYIGKHRLEGAPFATDRK